MTVRGSAGVGRLGQTLRHAGIVLAGNGVSKGLLLASELLLAWQLGAAEFGIFSLALSLILLLAALAVFGLGFGIIQFLSGASAEGAPQKRDSIVRTGLLLVAAIGAIVGVALALLGDALARHVFEVENFAVLARLIAPVIVLEAANQAMSAAFRGLRRFRDHVLVFDLLRNLVLFGGAVLGLVVDYDVRQVLIILGAGSSCGFAVGIWKLRRFLFNRESVRHDLGHIVELMRYSRLLGLWSVLQVSANRTLLVIGGMFFAAEIVGVLAVAVRVCSVLDFFRTAINLAAQVEFADLFHTAQRKTLERLFSNLAQLLMLIVTAVGIALVVCAGPIMTSFGNEFADYYWVIWIILPVQIINIGAGPVGQILIACNKRMEVLCLSMLELGLQIIFVGLGTYFFDLIGAVVGEALRTLSYVALRQGLLRNLVGFWGFGLRQFGMAVAAVAAVAVTTWAFPISGSVDNMLVAAAAVAVYLVLVLGGEMLSRRFANVENY